MRWWDTCSVTPLYSPPTPGVTTNVAIALSPPCSSSVPPSVPGIIRQKNKAARILARSVWIALSCPLTWLQRSFETFACTWDEVRGYTYLPNMQYALDCGLWIVDGGCTFCSDGNLWHIEIGKVYVSRIESRSAGPIWLNEIWTDLKFVVEFSGIRAMTVWPSDRLAVLRRNKRQEKREKRRVYAHELSSWTDLILDLGSW